MLRCAVRNLATLARPYSVQAEAAKVRELQEAAMQKENCILVDMNDRPLGMASKRDCHRVSADGNLKLHRAFSVFLFNSKGEMLLQRRSKHKITFPDTYTNSCCSHPLFDIEEEKDELNAMGVRKAAQRRLNYELGIPTSQARPENFHYITRMHYIHGGDGVWGENEITHILFLHKDVDLKPNPAEVSEIRFIRRENLDKELESLKAPLTPWFNLMQKHRLRTWWDNLNQLKKVEDHQNIQRF